MLLMLIWPEQEVMAHSARWYPHVMHRWYLAHRAYAHKTRDTMVLAQGVTLSTYIWQTVHGATLTNLLSVDLTKPHVHLGVVQAHNRLLSPDEALTSIPEARPRWWRVLPGTSVFR
jgi:hypothetical protein